MPIMGDDDIPIVVSFLLMRTCQVSIRLGKATPRHRFLQPRETLSHQKALNVEKERYVECVPQRDKLLSKGAKVKSKYKDMEELEKQEQSRHARISKAEKDLASAELELQNLPRYEPPKEKIEKLTTEILDLEQSAKEKRYQTKDKRSF
nr:structural maintenance of chromosomes protein 5 [Tanacetum cinerariifolium]